MATQAVTVQPGTNSTVSVAGTAIEAVPVNPNGGIITNPLTAADQGLTGAGAVAEPLYINPIGAAALAGNGSTFALAPGQSWIVIPGQTTPTSANAATAGHKFSVVFW